MTRSYTLEIVWITYLKKNRMNHHKMNRMIPPKTKAREEAIATHPKVKILMKVIRVMNRKHKLIIGYRNNYCLIFKK